MDQFQVDLFAYLNNSARGHFFAQNEKDKRVDIWRRWLVIWSDFLPLVHCVLVLWVMESSDLLGSSCSPGTFRCVSNDSTGEIGVCLPRRLLCDGRSDCPDGSDEDPYKCCKIIYYHWFFSFSSSFGRLSITCGNRHHIKRIDATISSERRTLFFSLTLDVYNISFGRYLLFFFFPPLSRMCQPLFFYFFRLSR